MSDLILISTFGVLSAGCYTLQPAGGIAPEPGTDVAFDVNDAGRAALGGSMGPEIGQITGRLISKDASNGEYLLAVSEVQLLRGGQQTWRGEQIRIKPEYVSNVYQRRLSKGRSYGLAAIGIGTLAFFAGRSIIGSGAVDPPKPPGDTALASRRPRSVRPLHTAFPPTH